MMYVSVITCLVCLVPILVRSLPVDEEYSASSSDYQSSADYPEILLLPMEAFTLNDQNGDGFITHIEYRKSNPNMPEMDSKTIFSNFDQDKDGRISRTEFKSQVQHNTPKPEEDCFTTLMKTCSTEFINAVKKWGSKQGDAMCHSLPVYKNCIQRERTTCSTESEGGQSQSSFDDEVNSLITRFRKSLCQDAHMPRVRPSTSAVSTNIMPTSAVSDAVQAGIRQVRSGRRQSKRYRSRLRRQSCIVSTMRPCNNQFVSALQGEDEDPCHSLIKYRQCIHKSTRRCSDPNIHVIQRAIKFLTKEHRRVKICSKLDK
ncbi:uncharacterized protein [Asterias amurensis]|uniref:uncharacterized protein n=1 Tax=Asterias amurensis TaxID=7602 RepID=UPI003AB13A62